MTRIKPLAVVALLLFGRATAQETTITVELSTEEVAEVTSDASRVSEADVRRWMQLSQYASYNRPVDTGLCFDGRQYIHCGNPHEGVNLHNARLNVDKTRAAVIRELDSRHDPPGLLPVVSFLKRTQSFWLWIESQELAFFESGDVAVLESGFDHVDPKLSCGAVLGQIRKAKNTAGVSQLVRHDWNNCVSDEGGSK